MADPAQDQPWLQRNLPELMTMLGAFLAPLRLGRADFYGQRHGPSIGAPLAALGPMLYNQRLDQLRGTGMDKLYAATATEPQDYEIPTEGPSTEEGVGPLPVRGTRQVPPSPETFLNRIRSTMSPQELSAVGPASVTTMMQRMMPQGVTTQHYDLNDRIRIVTYDKLGNPIHQQDVPKGPKELSETQLLAKEHDAEHVRLGQDIERVRAINPDLAKLPTEQIASYLIRHGGMDGKTTYKLAENDPYNKMSEGVTRRDESDKEWDRRRAEMEANQRQMRGIIEAFMKSMQTQREDFQLSLHDIQHPKHAVLDAETGDTVDVNEGEIRKNPNKYIPFNDAEQEKSKQASDTFNQHIKKTYESILKVLPKTGNQLTMDLGAFYRKFKNDPDAKAFFETLESFSSIMASRAAAGSGQGGRGYWFVKQMQKALPNSSDNLGSALAKLEVVSDLNYKMQVDNIPHRPGQPSVADKLYLPTLKTIQQGRKTVDPNSQYEELIRRGMAARQRFEATGQ